ncbi:transcription factor ILI6-like [Musa acuminata AAA Group]|uniref:transcription factor ILI6-like n=1 Tax=Musa acuminata AAA Group TaxID=214697 RepID=UPI0031DFEC11
MYVLRTIANTSTALSLSLCMTSSSFLITPTPQQSDSVAPTLALVSSSLTIYILACDFSSERLHPIANKMASRRSRSTQATSSRITDEQIADLLAKLQALLPEHRIRSTDRVSAAEVLQDACNHIRSLQREVDGLSGRLAQLLAMTDSSDAQAAVIRSLLM